MSARREALPWILPAVIAMFSTLMLFGVFFMDRVNDPFVSYYGDVMRRSELRQHTLTATYCQGLTPFAIGPMYACFDSEQEVLEFAATR